MPKTKRICVTLNYKIYERLKNHGKFGDSFNDIILRLIEEVELSRRLVSNK
jgi:predicted CopG family antitoxin